MEVSRMQDEVDAVVKTIRDLPASVREKVFEHFQKSSTSCSSPEKTDFSIIIKSLIDGSQNISGENTCSGGNSPLGESKTKQRTLDNWLIKKSNSPLGKIKETNKTFQPRGDVNNAEILSHTAESIVSSTPCSASSTDDILVACNKSIKCSKSTESKCGKTKDVSVIGDKLTSVSPEANNLTTEPSYNLRSKRKPSKVAPNVESDDNVFKDVKNQAQNNFDTEVTNERNIKNIRSEDAESNCQSTQDLAGELSTISVSTSCNAFSPQKCVDSKLVDNRSAQGNSGSTNTSCVKKATFNRRTKKKSGKNSENAVESDNIPVDTAQQSSVNNNMPTVLENEVNNLQSSSQYNYEAFCNVKKACTDVGLDIFEILRHEGVQNLLSDQKIHNDGVVFIGTHKSVMGRLQPVVHAHESKAKLLENLYEVQKSARLS